MKYLNKSIKSVLAGLFIFMALVSMSSWAGPGPGGPGGPDPEPASTQVFDTSFAVEFSYSCLGGGCHETDQTLVDEYAASKMTHTMVKCNACHGTHTAETVGQEKPNLTGYYPGIGATGYTVGEDRCKVCHADIYTKNNAHPVNSGKVCMQCHAPHVFPK